MRYKLTLSYDGTNFKGFQTQINERTVEEELDLAISKLFKENIHVVGSGRTDAHVHALGQVVHFDSEKEINPESLKKGLNSTLPDDIVINDVEYVNDNFHARFDVKSKEYRYYISKSNNPIERNYSVYLYNLDINKMREAIKYFIGEHDFTSYSFFVPLKPTIRTIYDAKINELEDKYEIIFIGNGFLKYMVRIMVGTLIEVGFNKKEPLDILKIFELKDRKYAGKTADPKGLFLYKVNYWFKNHIKYEIII